MVEKSIGGHGIEIVAFEQSQKTNGELRGKTGDGSTHPAITYATTQASLGFEHTPSDTNAAALHTTKYNAKPDVAVVINGAATDFSFTARNTSSTKPKFLMAGTTTAISQREKVVRPSIIDVEVLLRSSIRHQRQQQEPTRHRSDAETWYDSNAHKSTLESGVQAILYGGCMSAARRSYDTVIRQKIMNCKEEHRRKTSDSNTKKHDGKVAPFSASAASCVIPLKDGLKFTPPPVGANILLMPVLNTDVGTKYDIGEQINTGKLIDVQSHVNELNIGAGGVVGGGGVGKSSRRRRRNRENREKSKNMQNNHQQHHQNNQQHHSCLHQHPHMLPPPPPPPPLSGVGVIPPPPPPPSFNYLRNANDEYACLPMRSYITTASNTAPMYSNNILPSPVPPPPLRVLHQYCHHPSISGAVVGGGVYIPPPPPLPNPPHGIVYSDKAGTAGYCERRRNGRSHSPSHSSLSHRDRRSDCLSRGQRNAVEERQCYRRYEEGDRSNDRHHSRSTTRSSRSRSGRRSEERRRYESDRNGSSSRRIKKSRERSGSHSHDSIGWSRSRSCSRERRSSSGSFENTTRRGDDARHIRSKNRRRGRDYSRKTIEGHKGRRKKSRSRTRSNSIDLRSFSRRRKENGGYLRSECRELIDGTDVVAVNINETIAGDEKRSVSEKGEKEGLPTDFMFSRNSGRAKDEKNKHYNQSKRDGSPLLTLMNKTERNRAPTDGMRGDHGKDSRRNEGRREGEKDFSSKSDRITSSDVDKNRADRSDRGREVLEEQKRNDWRNSQNTNRVRNINGSNFHKIDVANGESRSHRRDMRGKGGVVRSSSCSASRDYCERDLSAADGGAGCLKERVKLEDQNEERSSFSQIMNTSYNYRVCDNTHDGNNLILSSQNTDMASVMKQRGNSVDEKISGSVRKGDHEKRRSCRDDMCPSPAPTTGERPWHNNVNYGIQSASSNRRSLDFEEYRRQPYRGDDAGGGNGLGGSDQGNLINQRVIYGERSREGD